VDFPGFGVSPAPPENWGTAEYADAAAELIRSYRAVKKIIWVGHSFGGRVGIQLAARHPDLLDRLFLVASPGLPHRRSLMQKLSHHSRVTFFKTMKIFAPVFGMSLDDLRKKFGSADYRNAGKMRPIFLRIIHENLSAPAKQIKCPTYLLYGSNDTETPPEIGERLAQLIPKSTLSVLPGLDHYSILTTGRHLLLKRLSDFIGAG
jgi:pimeloyl-ACP methyl ester carboxylesterase